MRSSSLYNTPHHVSIPQSFPFHTTQQQTLQQNTSLELNLRNCLHFRAEALPRHVTSSQHWIEIICERYVGPTSWRAVSVIYAQ